MIALPALRSEVVRDSLMNRCTPANATTTRSSSRLSASGGPASDGVVIAVALVSMIAWFSVPTREPPPAAGVDADSACADTRLAGLSPSRTDSGLPLAPHTGQAEPAQPLTRSAERRSPSIGDSEV
ncbi:hypothetical protein [Streptomyces sp. NPDC003393]